ncbi:13421_t:CDS:2, partial [Gigaspora margarita]
HPQKILPHKIVFLLDSLTQRIYNFSTNVSMNVSTIKQLAHIMLTNDEWIFIDELNDVLRGFEEITILLNRNTYITIFLMYLAILALVKTLKSSLQQFYIELDSTDISKLTFLDSIKEIIDNAKNLVKIKEIDPKLEIIHKKINISIPIIMNGIMHKYWQSVMDIGMLAYLLDPCFKSYSLQMQL